MMIFLANTELLNNILDTVILALIVLDSLQYFVLFGIVN